jgi:membrane-associated protease RseP (regulator of RpoE activity)
VRAPFRLTATLFSIVGIASVAVAATSTPTADGVRDNINRFVRVQAIVRRIMAANVETCQAKRGDFGFTSVSPNPDAPDTVSAAWTDGLGLGDGSTVVAVYGSGPAEAAGLRVGDNIVAVDGVQWSLAPERRKAFKEALDVRSRQKLLTVGRGTTDVMIDMTPQTICTADVALRTRDNVYAAANGSTIIVDEGMERLLTSDDELALVIGHEAAHIFLGHTGADRAKKFKNAVLRKQMEQQADALGVRLMLKAGFSPEASATAHPKLAKAMRGPISRLVGLHGPYMSTDDRTAFIKSEAEAARSEQANASTGR